MVVRDEAVLIPVWKEGGDCVEICSGGRGTRWGKGEARMVGKGDVVAMLSGLGVVKMRGGGAGDWKVEVKVEVK